MFAAVVAVYAMGQASALPASQVGALAFTALVAGNLGLIVVYRAGRTVRQTLRARNPAFVAVATGAMAMLTIVTQVQGPARWFGFEPPPTGLWLVAMLLPLAGAALLKATRRDRAATIPPSASQPV